MKTRIQILTACCLVAVFSMVGCGPGSPGKVAPISGRLTLDGKPMPGVEIVFSPMAQEGNSNPGPWSVAMTDDDGKFELKTRYQEDGAVVGSHNVTMEYNDMEPGAMDVLRQELIEIKASGEGTEEGVQEVIDRINALKQKLKGREMIPSSANHVFVVPPGGNKDVKFELVSE